MPITCGQYPTPDPSPKREGSGMLINIYGRLSGIIWIRTTSPSLLWGRGQGDGVKKQAKHYKYLRSYIVEEK
jgi:hypothetical protein